MVKRHLQIVGRHRIHAARRLIDLQPFVEASSAQSVDGIGFLERLKILVSAVRFRPRPPIIRSPWFFTEPGVFCLGGLRPLSGGRRVSVRCGSVRSGWINAVQFAHAYARGEGMKHYVEQVPQPEFETREKGYTFVSHPQEVGAGYFDDVTTLTQSGSSSVQALTGSTKEEQFH